MVRFKITYAVLWLYRSYLQMKYSLHTNKLIHKISISKEHQMDSVEKLKLFVRRRWINQVLPEELSVWHQKMATNNEAENYYGRLKFLIKCSKPRIWNFLDTLNEIILDTNNEIGRLKEGSRITRERKKKNVQNDLRRQKYKEFFLR